MILSGGCYWPRLTSCPYPSPLPALFRHALRERRAMTIVSLFDWNGRWTTTSPCGHLADMIPGSWMARRVRGSWGGMSRRDIWYPLAALLIAIGNVRGAARFGYPNRSTSSLRAPDCGSRAPGSSRRTVDKQAAAAPPFSYCSCRQSAGTPALASENLAPRAESGHMR